MITTPELVRLRLLLEKISDQVAPSEGQCDVIDAHLFLDLKEWVAKLTRQTRGHTIHD